MALFKNARSTALLLALAMASLAGCGRQARPVPVGPEQEGPGNAPQARAAAREVSTPPTSSHWLGEHGWESVREADTLKQEGVPLPTATLALCDGTVLYLVALPSLKVKWAVTPKTLDEGISLPYGMAVQSIHYPCWCPGSDSVLLAVESGPGPESWDMAWGERHSLPYRRESLVRWNLSSDEFEQVFSRDRASLRCPSESPDGKWIAFLNDGLCLADVGPDSVGVIEKVADVDGCGYAQWTRDSKAFLFSESEGHQGCSFDVETRKVTRHPLKGMVTLLPGGGSIALMQNNGRLLRILSFPQLEVMKEIRLRQPGGADTQVVAVSSGAVAYSTGWVVLVGFGDEPYQAKIRLDVRGVSSLSAIRGQDLAAEAETTGDKPTQRAAEREVAQPRKAEDLLPTATLASTDGQRLDLTSLPSGESRTVLTLADLRKHLSAEGGTEVRRVLALQGAPGSDWLLMAVELGGSRTAVVRWNVTSGEIRELGSCDGVCRWFSEAPDGKHLAFLRGTSLCVAELGEGGMEEVENVPSEFARSGHPQWLPDGKSFLFTERRGEVRRVHLESGEVTHHEASGTVTLLPGGDAIALLAKEGEMLLLLSFPGLELKKSMRLRQPADPDSQLVAINEETVAYLTGIQRSTGPAVVVVGLGEKEYQVPVYHFKGYGFGLACVGKAKAGSE